ncbi:MAG: DUF72 domain-containing protein [Synechococcales bacterium]|nr:DUF72 domain-containing protein [Synechococcales bacterium]
MGNFYIGCAVWAYKEWVGEFYPPGSRASDYLSLYSRRLTAVEGNTTFYSVPGAEMVTRWGQETPPDFRFCLKLPRTVTHQGALMAHFGEAIAFLDHLQPLANRLGPYLAQLPPSYSPAQMADLVAFLTAFPRQRLPIAVEVRHADWFTTQNGTQLATQLQTLGVGRVLLDTRPIYECPDDPQIHSERRKPQVPLQPVVTAPFTLVRYISHPDLSRNIPYLMEWVERVSQWLRQGTTVYFFVHCPIEARSPGIARHFQHLLEQAGVPVPALPWNLIPDGPTQLSLFSA